MRNGIHVIDFPIIEQVWKEKLWPERISPTETHSAMIYMSNSYAMGNFDLPIRYFGCFEDDTLVGVNSGHMCTDNNVRSRGLWVESTYRGKGYGKLLLIATIDWAKHLRANGIWSFPRKTSWITYESAGFTLTSDWQTSETSNANGYCYLGF